MKIALIILLILLIPQLLWAPMDFDKEYTFTTYGDFSKGLNLFSSPDNVKDNQALDLNNFLFYGARLRARKGIQALNATSLGSYGIDGVHLFQKQNFEELLVSHHGIIWVSAEDSNEFVNFLKENIDSTARVRVTQNDSSITGVPDSTFFTQLGYDDSIRIYLNDSLHYVYQILHDTFLYLYNNIAQATDTTALFNAPVTVPIDKPTLFDPWLNKVFIAGSKGVITYDGETADTSALDTLTFTITDTIRVNQMFKVKTDPSPNTAGYEPGDLEGYYVVGYNDEAGGGHVLNIPLRVINNTRNWISIIVDTSFTANTQHIDSNGVFRIRPPFTSEYKVFEGVIDAVRDDADSTGYWYNYNIYDHSVFSTYDSTSLDFGYYYYKNMDSSSGEGEFETICRFQAMGTGDSNYLYVSCLNTMTNLPEVGDTFEVWRKVSSSQRDAPSFIVHWQDRQWRAGYADNPNYLWWSHIFDPDSTEGDYFAYVEQDDGDVITALKVLSFQDALLIFKTKHIYSVTGEGPLDWWINDLVDGIGTPSQASVISYGRSVYFYDYTGFYLFDGYSPNKISWQIESIIADSINKDYAYLIVGGYFDQHLWWSYPSGSATKNNRTILYNLEDGAWTKTDINASAYFVGQIETDSNGVLIGDPDSGKVYRYGLSYLDGTSSYDATYESPWLNVRDEYDFVKDFKDLHVFYDKHDSTIIYIDYLKDFVDSVIWTDTIGIDDNDIPTYHRRAIQGDMLAQRIKMDIRVERIDGEFYLPFFRLKWKPVGEKLYDE